MRSLGWDDGEALHAIRGRRRDRPPRTPASLEGRPSRGGHGRRRRIERRPGPRNRGPEEERVRDLLLKIQDDLFTVGAELAMTRAAEGTQVPRIEKEHIARLEAGIESFDVGRVTEFILPRGSEGLVRLHWARTVARPAARRVVSLTRQEP